MDKEFLDKGPSTTAELTGSMVTVKALRNNIMEIVSENNNANSTVILNTSSYIFSGLSERVYPLII